MKQQTPLKLALVAINAIVLFSWAWLAAEVIAPAPAIGGALIFLALEALIWQLLAGKEPAKPPQEGRSPERVAALLGRTEGRRHAIREETTGLYNRWYLEARLEQEALRCDRYGHSMAVIVLRAGTVNLSEFSMDGWQSQSAATAERCLKVVRNIDLSAFLAPFEFAICLIQCDRAGAEMALARLRQELSEFSVDAGVAVYPDDGCEALALIDLARVKLRAHTGNGVAQQSRPPLTSQTA